MTLARVDESSAVERSEANDSSTRKRSRSAVERSEAKAEAERNEGRSWAKRSRPASLGQGHRSRNRFLTWGMVHNTICFWSFEKHSLHYSFNGTSSENYVVETVLGRTSEPISIQVERWSSLTRLPCAYIIHDSVVTSKPLKLRENAM